MIPLGELMVDTSIAHTPNRQSSGKKRRLNKKYSTAKLGEMAHTGKESPASLLNQNIKAQIEVRSSPSNEKTL
jgi:hypothetical protein